MERLGLVALVLGTVGAFAAYPSSPNYDTFYSLVWGRELAHLDGPSFDAFRAPTQHPLALVVGAALQPLGENADRAFVLLSLLSLAALVAGLYRLARDAFTPIVGLAAAAVLATRFDFANYAAQAYVDVAMVALLVWAAALEVERPRRGAPVFVLLALAGLLRPEAWLLGGIYLLWMLRGPQSTPAAVPGSRTRAGWVAWALAPPLLWGLTDLIATGDPLFSFTATTGTVEELGRAKSLGELPGALLSSATELLKAPVLAAGLFGLGAALRIAPRRSAVPGVLLAAGLATYLLVAAAGFAVIDRYLLTATAALCVFCGFALGGFTLLEGRSRRIWRAAAAMGLLAAVAFTATRIVSFRSFEGELAWRTEAHDDLERVLTSAAVTKALKNSRCGSIITPTHKLVPDVRWTLDLQEAEVVASSDPARAWETVRGVAIYPIGRRTVEKQGFDAAASPLTLVPAPGFRLIARVPRYAVFARCAPAPPFPGQGGRGRRILVD
jgi:dolichyl-phosphate-mannose-protein mannosyltransferase